MMVSMKVPVMETKACRAGTSVLAAAAAMGAEPSPDSLEKIPRYPALNCHGKSRACESASSRGASESRTEN